jgi:hypothetical protein
LAVARGRQEQQAGWAKSFRARKQKAKGHSKAKS